MWNWSNVDALIDTNVIWSSPCVWNEKKDFFPKNILQKKVGSFWRFIALTRCEDFILINTCDNQKNVTNF